VAKKPETSEQQTAAADRAMSQTNGSAARSPKSKSPPKARKTPASARKTGMGKQKSAEPQISDDAIRMRAYFIAEERRRMAVPGDPHSDWIEARRQLIAELARP
jgi:hypothetical protein